MFVITGGDRRSWSTPGRRTRPSSASTSATPSSVPTARDPVTQLNGAGIDPADVRDVVYTHLHWDHCSNVGLFPNARFTVQDEELQYAINPIPLHRRAYQHLPRTAPPWLRVLSRLNVIRGAVEIAPGVSTVPLSGHTPGSQGVLVETDKGPYLIAGDCLDSYDNLELERRGRRTARPVLVVHRRDPVRRELPPHRVTRLRAIPSHDERVLETRTFG